MRNPVFDIMKGIGIVLMIIGHGSIPSIIRNFIFSFHMPLFFMIGGFLYKGKSNSLNIVRSSTRRLLLPYIVTGLMTVLILYLFGAKEMALDRFLGIFFGPNGSKAALFYTPHVGAVWFLLALFWCRLLFNYIFYHTTHWLAISFLLSFLSFLFGHFIVNPPLGLLIGMTALCFYSLGVYIKLYRIEKWGEWTALICWFFCIFFSHLEMATYSYFIYPLDIVGAFGGTLFVYYIAKYVNTYMVKLGGIFSRLGKNTLTILCYHQIITYIFICIAKNGYLINPFLLICYNLLLSIGISYIHNKLYPFLLMKLKNVQDCI